MIPEDLHQSDPVLDAISGDALPAPVAFGLQDDLFIVFALVVQIRCPGRPLLILDHLGRILGDFVGRLLVSHDASKDRVDVLLVHPVEEFGALNAVCFFPGELPFPHARERNLHPLKLGQKGLVLVAINFLKEVIHDLVGGHEVFA